MSGPVKTQTKNASVPARTNIRSQGRTQDAAAGPYADMLALQRAAGNRAVHGLVSPAAPPARRDGTYLPAIVRSVVESGGGQPLAPELRVDMESRFHQGFGSVRVHTSPQADLSARAINAHAYTVGNDVVFASGRYTPQTETGKHLLAHELAHVLQQGRNGSIRSSLGQNDLLEEDAVQAASTYREGQRPIRVTQSSRLGLARDPRSLTETLNPSDLSKPDLQKEILELQQWLAKRGNVSDPTVEPMVQALNRLESEEHRRNQAAKAPKNPLIPTVANVSDKQRLIEAIKVVQSIRQVGSNVYEVAIAGETKRLTQADVDSARQKAGQALLDGVRRVESLKDQAVNGYSIQSETDKKHWIVAPIIKFIGNIKDPGPFLMAEAGKASKQIEEIRAAIKSGDLLQAATLMGEAEASATKAKLMYQAYWEGIISAGEMTVKVLEVTRDVSFIAVGIIATIATAGLAAGATTAFGVEIGGSAALVNTVATAAAIAPTVAETAARVAYGDPVDWGQVTLDITLNLILSRFGGKLTGGIAGKLIARNPAARKLEASVLEGIVHSVINGKLTGLIHLSISTVYHNLKQSGKQITWEQFMDAVINQILDPKQTALDVLNGAIATGVARTKGASITPTTTPTETPAAVTPTAKPTTEALQPASPTAPTPSAVNEAAATTTPAPAVVEGAQNVAPIAPKVATPATTTPPMTSAPETTPSVQPPAHTETSPKAATPGSSLEAVQAPKQGDVESPPPKPTATTTPEAQGAPVSKTPATAVTPAPDVEGSAPAKPMPSTAGGTGEEVWVNTRTGTYHRKGSRFFQNTKEGTLMPLEAAEAAQYRESGKPAPKPAPGTVTRRADGTTVIQNELGAPTRRRGYEKDLLPGSQVGLEGYERAHSQGAGFGTEAREGILYAPREVNQEIQNRGIESFIRDLQSMKAPDVKFLVTTETQAHPGTRRLKEINYRIDALRPGDAKPTRVYEVSIEVGAEPNNPKIVIDAQKYGAIEEFVR